MMEDDFYATVKLKSGEEIFAKIIPLEEDENILLLVSNPVIVSEVKTRSGDLGYKIEPWLKTTTEDLFTIHMADVLTMTENIDMKMISMYNSYVNQCNKLKTREAKIDRKMGYIANINDAKDLLEKLYKES